MHYSTAGSDVILPILDTHHELKNTLSQEEIKLLEDFNFPISAFNSPESYNTFIEQVFPFKNFSDFLEGRRMFQEIKEKLFPEGGIQEKLENISSDFGDEIDAIVQATSNKVDKKIKQMELVGTAIAHFKFIEEYIAKTIWLNNNLEQDSRRLVKINSNAEKDIKEVLREILLELYCIHNILSSWGKEKDVQLCRKTFKYIFSLGEGIFSETTFMIRDDSPSQENSTEKSIRKELMIRKDMSIFYRIETRTCEVTEEDTEMEISL